MPRTNALYRMYDSADRLLYVGITCNPGSRFVGHHKKDWWRSVHRITLEHFSTRELVAHAEVVAIKTEMPIHNIIHNNPLPLLPADDFDFYNCGCESCCQTCWFACCASPEEIKDSLEMSFDLDLEIDSCGREEDVVA